MVRILLEMAGEQERLKRERERSIVCGVNDWERAG